MSSAVGLTTGTQSSQKLRTDNARALCRQVGPQLGLLRQYRGAGPADGMKRWEAIVAGDLKIATRSFIDVL